MVAAGGTTPNWWARLLAPVRTLADELTRQGDADVWFWTGLRSTPPHLPPTGPTLDTLSAPGPGPGPAVPDPD